MSFSFATGDMRIHRLVELIAPFRPALQMLPALSEDVLAANRNWLHPNSLDANDNFILCYQSYIVQTPHHNILVDSCIGNDKVRRHTDWHMKSDKNWMLALASAGLGVEDIDYVMCTHLHGDHVGWNTTLNKGAWLPTFPRAKYIFGKRELEAIQLASASAPNQTYLDSVLPILDSGQAHIVENSYELGDHVRILPTPGHTDGHVSFCFGKNFDRAVMTGDAIHVPLQARYPELSYSGDKDASLSARTRRDFFERYCDTATLCCTAHFSSPAVGRISRWGDGYRVGDVR